MLINTVYKSKAVVGSSFLVNLKKNAVFLVAKDDAASDTAESEEAAPEPEPVSSSSAPVASSQNAHTTTTFADDQVSDTACSCATKT